MAEKNAFGVEKKVKKEAKVLQPDSIFAHLDADGDGKITGKDFAMLRGKKKDNKKKKPSMMMMAMKGKK